MFFICMILLMTAGFSCLLTFTTHMYYGWIALWIFSGFVAALFVFVIYALIFVEVGARTTPKSKFKVFNLRQATVLFLMLYNIRITWEGIENVPKGNFVVYANHKSNLDPVCLYYALNRIVSAIGKKSLFGFWPMNHICKCFGAISMDRDNDREAARNMITAIKAVKDGLPMMIFPEGGIKSRDVEEMVNLRAGAYKLATKANAVIIPATIIGSSEISKKKMCQRKNIHIIFHKGITPEEYKGKNTTEIGTYVEELINEDIRAYAEK